MVRRLSDSSVVHNAQYKLALATCSGVQNFRIVMQRFISNWLCSIKKKLWKRRQIFFFFYFLRPLHLICPGKKIADIEFYFYFFFVLRLSHLAEKICKTKNKKTLASLIKICQMKQLTPILNILHFQCFKLIRSGKVFHVLFTNAYSLICNQIVCFAFFFRQTLTLLPSVVFLKPVSIFSEAMKICYSKVVYCLHVHVILPLAFSYLCKCTIYFEHAHL